MMSAGQLARPMRRDRRASPWKSGPRKLAAAAMAVDVWRVDMAGVDDEVLAGLTATERERASRVVDRRAGLLWARSRGVLRVLLGRYLNAAPEALELTATAAGKPALGGAWAGRALHFNLSHSGELALYALTTCGSVGVDVQRMREPSRRGALDEAAVAARVFGTAAARRLRTLPHERREPEFLRMWTRHEATLKQRGLGLAADRPEEGQAPWIAELDVGPGAAAAVACVRAPVELRLWDWTEAQRPSALG